MKYLKIMTITFLLILHSTVVFSAPLPDGIIMRIDQGQNAGMNYTCDIGSCFAMEISPGMNVWTNIGPGTDGGIVIGKAQISGGQELGSSESNTTSGELTGAWNFFGSYGTLYTMPNGEFNVFADVPCVGADCTNKTAFNVLNMAWGGFAFPFTSEGPCTHPNCSVDHQNGIFVTDYHIEPFTGGSWSLNYSSVIQSGMMASARIFLILRGTVDMLAPPPPPPSPPPPPVMQNVCFTILAEQAVALLVLQMFESAQTISCP